MRRRRLLIGLHGGRPITRVLVIGLALGFLIPPRPTTLDGIPVVSKPRQAATASAYARLPLSFEANLGQTDPQVKFLARGSGFTLFLTPREAVLALRRARGSQGSADVVRITPVAADPRSSITALNKLPGRVNYFRGNDPARWQTNIPTYAQVRYRDLYPGIDLVFYGTQRQLEYDFIIAPGTNPGRIALRFDGVERLEVDRTGELLLQVNGGQIRMTRPLAYQEVSGVRRPVAARYALVGAREVGVDVGAYQASLPLVIDPVLAYGSYLGGSATVDRGDAIAVDASGSAYVTGVTDSIDFPTTAGTFDDTFNGTFDVFVTKVNATGTALIYSTYLGGALGEDGLAIAVDGVGNAYVAGWTRSSDFPVTAGAFDTTANGDFDAFVAKLNPSGAALLYSTYLGGTAEDFGKGIAIDAGGNAYVTGWTASTNYPTTPGAFDTTHNGMPPGRDAFITKLNAAGSALVYSTYLGSSFDDFGHAITVDAGGNAYVAGITYWTDFPTTAGAFDTTFNGLNDLFVTKLNANGDSLVFSTYIGGSGEEPSLADAGLGASIAVDGSGNVYVGGATSSANFPTTAGAFDTVLGGQGVITDAFVTKLNVAGSMLVYSTFVGGSSFDQIRGLKVDSAGNAYLTGWTSSADFPTVDAFQSTLAGGDDVFVTKLNGAGSALIYSTYLGGSSPDDAFGIALDPARTAYVAGSTDSPNFPVTAGAFDTTFGSRDGFVAKIATPSFSDIPLSDWGYTWIEQVYHRGITAGCATNPLRYCPDNNVTRREMAVFLIRGRGESAPTGCAGTFADVPASDWGCPWAERLYALGVTAGCATNPLRYCPDNTTTRREMAVFLNRAAGQSACSGCTQTFSDVPPSDWGFGWIERLYQRGITAGCATGPLRYCPDNNVTRREMAVFLIRNWP